MFLAKALENRVLTLADAEKSYKEHVCAVNQTVTGVITSKLPALSSPPPDWDQYTQAYAKANSEALTWVNQVMGHLLSVPDDVRSFNDTIVAALADAQNQTRSLIQTPTDPIALNALNRDLNLISGQLNLVISFVSGSLSAVQSFQSTLPDLAAQLHAIATKSTADAGADEQQIETLRTDVKALQADIDRLTAEIVAMGIADAAAITLGTLASIVAFPEGLVAWLFCGPAIAVATTVIVLDGIKISEDTGKIESDQSRIKGLTADVTALHLLADQMSLLASQTEGLTIDLHAILAEWQVLESEVAQAMNDIRLAISQANSRSFQAVANDLQEASELWNEAYAQAGSLELDIQVNTGDFALGMSSAQVKGAMDGGRTLGLIDYVNGIGQRQGIRQRALTH
ncbi:MAG: hypothetical protein QG622_483 [Actinomycetota bacterium]|nr:hypothetical protein [Actinomycetota bacterium]